MSDGKYVVFKAEDWERIRSLKGDMITAGVSTHDLPEPLDDAVVIRTGDKFAGPTLHAYAGAVLSEVEIQVNSGTAEGLRLSGELMSVADYMHDRAVEADEKRRDGSSSLPD